MLNEQMTSELSERIPEWKILKNSLVTSYFNEASLYKKNLDSFSLVSIYVDQNDAPLLINEKWGNETVSSYYIFTHPELSKRMNKNYSLKEVESFAIVDSLVPRLKVKTIMLGELCSSLSLLKKPAAIRVNPIKVDTNEAQTLTLSEEVLFAPIFDSFTQKLLLTEPDDAKALLSISPDEQKRFGIEFVFYLLSDRYLSDDRDTREEQLKSKLNEMAFVLPRVPVPKGSGSFIAVLLDLENELEEMAFIREYQTFDSYSDPIFVTSSLKLMNGKLDEIHYNGETVDTIFGPLIDWQKMRHSTHSHI